MGRGSSRAPASRHDGAREGGTAGSGRAGHVPHGGRPRRAHVTQRGPERGPWTHVTPGGRSHGRALVHAMKMGGGLPMRWRPWK